MHLLNEQVLSLLTNIGAARRLAAHIQKRGKASVLQLLRYRRPQNGLGHVCVCERRSEGAPGVLLIAAQVPSPEQLQLLLVAVLPAYAEPRGCKTCRRTAVATGANHGMDTDLLTRFKPGT